MVAVVRPPQNTHSRARSIPPSQSVPKSATPRRPASVSLDHWTQLWNAQKRQGRPNVQTAREIVPIGTSRGLATRDQLCFDPGRPPPGGAKPGSNRISCLPRARHPYYAARRAFCQKNLDGNETSLIYERGLVASCAYFDTELQSLYKRQGFPLAQPRQLFVSINHFWCKY